MELPKKDLKCGHALKEEDTEEDHSGHSPVTYGLQIWKLKSKKEAQKNISQHQAYQGPMTSEQAQEKLDDQSGNCYLMRYSKTHKKYMLSVSNKTVEGAATHYPIKITTEHDFCEYEIEGSAKKFDDISELLLYYEDNPLTDKQEHIGKQYTSHKRAKLAIPTDLDVIHIDDKENEASNNKQGRDSPIAKAQNYSPFVNASCLSCKKQIFPEEGVSFHKSCFRCTKCNCQLESGQFFAKFLCKQHYMQPSNPESDNIHEATLNLGLHQSLHATSPLKPRNEETALCVALTPSPNHPQPFQRLLLSASPLLYSSPQESPNLQTSKRENSLHPRTTSSSQEPRKGEASFSHTSDSSHGYCSPRAGVHDSSTPMLTANIQPSGLPEINLHSLQISGYAYPAVLTALTEQNLSTSDAPSLVEFISFPKGKSKVNLAVEIGAHYHDFGVLLLNDESGNLISSIEKGNKIPRDIVCEIFKKWRKGTGRQPVTWKTLVAVLIDVGLKSLAIDVATQLQ